jgi:hypothetical protein
MIKMLETILAFMKTLPSWLMTVAEVMIVGLTFMTAVTFLAGIWCGMRLIGKRFNQVASIEFMPPKITFRDRNDRA